MPRSRGTSGCGWQNELLESLTELNASDTSKLIAQLKALRTTDEPGCGADAPTVILTISDTHSAQHVYNSSFYAGCNDTTRPATTLPPWIAYWSLSDLTQFLYKLPRNTDEDAGTP